MTEIREGQARFGARFMLNHGGVMWQRDSFGPSFPDHGDEIDAVRNDLADVYAVAELLLKWRSEELGIDPGELLKHISGE